MIFFFFSVSSEIACLPLLDSLIQRQFKRAVDMMLTLSLLPRFCMYSPTPIIAS